jgi:hypothetical protein
MVTRWRFGVCVVSLVFAAGCWGDAGEALEEDSEEISLLCLTNAQCDDHNACTTDTCKKNKCHHVDVTDGTTCDDGRSCTTHDVCTTGVCAGSPSNSPESACNGIDDDCDGLIDEDYVSDTSCFLGGGCASGNVGSTCTNGVETACKPGAPTGVSEALCNGIDDDCDGLVDENYVSTTSCFLPGACTAGNVGSTCMAGVELACQPGAPSGVSETLCNGIDDDCDGKIDEDYVSTTSCFLPGACTASNVGSTCMAGVELACQPGAPSGVSEALCNGVDDDCDGKIDENYASDTSCFQTGACATSNVGSSCVNGVETACSAGAPTGGSEAVCNGVDDDCDGRIDEDAIGCLCTYPGQPGACANGTECCGAVGTPSSGEEGACALLATDPQHCGACDVDCGTYVPQGDGFGGMLTCTSNADLRMCTNGGDCLSAGIASNCEDINGGVGRCGRCVSGIVERLVSIGTCNLGQCEVTCPSGQCGSHPCAAPSVDELEAAAFAGADSVSFDRVQDLSSAAACDAIVSNYRTDLAVVPCGTACFLDGQCGAGDRCQGGFCCPEGDMCVQGSCIPANIHAVAAGGYASSYFENTILSDPSRIGGVSAFDGTTIATFIDHGSGPGLAEVQGNGYGPLFTCTQTSGPQFDPFDAPELDIGPVGPVLDRSISYRTNWVAYAANVALAPCTDMELCKVTPQGRTAVAWCNQPCPGGICTPALTCVDVPERITALASAVLPVGQNPLTFASHRMLVVAHGTILSLLDLSIFGTPQIDIDLANATVYHPNAIAGESTPTAILGIAPISFVSAVFVEVRGTGATPNRFLLQVDPHDRSVRSARIYQRELLHETACPSGACPSGKTCVGGTCFANCNPGCQSPGVCTDVGSGTCYAPSGSGTQVCCVPGEIPPNFGATDGRLTIEPNGQLLRFVPSPNNQPATDWHEYRVVR